MSPFWGGLGKKHTFHVIDTLKLETFQVLWISIPSLRILRENRGWQIYERISAVLLTVLFE